ncbi:MAG: hypothetical protein ACK5CE_22895 [Actinomycetes bacterium]
MGGSAMIGGVPNGNVPLWGVAVVLALGGIVELARWWRRRSDG